MKRRDYIFSCATRRARQCNRFRSGNRRHRVSIELGFCATARATLIIQFRNGHDDDRTLVVNYDQRLGDLESDVMRDTRFCVFPLLASLFSFSYFSRLNIFK